ncbi:MAG: MoaD/ThiS family protein [Chloroflexota bacterium]|nr:MoaD/ThiS family protein [Chloroflexota bacterium]
MSTDDGIHVLIPTPLRGFTGGEARVDVHGGTVGEALDALAVKFPGLGERLHDEDGQLRRFVNVFVNGQNVRDIAGTATVLSPGDEIGIIPAMAGGDAS